MTDVTVNTQLLKEEILSLSLNKDISWEVEQGEFNLLVQFAKATPDSFWEDARVDNICFKLWHKQKCVPLYWLEDEPATANVIFEKLSKAIKSA